MAETCHFGRAAERLTIAQPALSLSIRQLEVELGVTLFHRTTRQVSLTAAGEFYRAETAQILQRLDEAAVGVRRFAEGRTGLLRLGLTGTASLAHLPRIARMLKEELPEVALSIQADLLTPEQCDRLRDGTLDLGILRPPAAGVDIATAPFIREDLALAIPAGHRLAGKRGVTISDLADEPWVMYSDGHSLVNAAVTRACSAAGFAPRREHEASGTGVLLALVASGLGVAVVPGAVRSYPLEGVALHDIPEAGAIELVLAYRASGASPIVDAVLPLLATLVTP